MADGQRTLEADSAKLNKIAIQRPSTSDEESENLCPPSREIGNTNTGKNIDDMNMCAEALVALESAEAVSETVADVARCEVPNVFRSETTTSFILSDEQEQQGNMGVIELLPEDSALSAEDTVDYEEFQRATIGDMEFSETSGSLYEPHGMF